MIGVSRRNRGPTIFVAWIAMAGTLGASTASAAQREGPPQPPTVQRIAPPPQAGYTITTQIQPAEYVGPCPAKVGFIANITAKTAGPVKYRLRTSDNAYDPVRELMFTAPETKSFVVTRSLPPPGSGWAYFEIVGPVSASSETAYYDIQCTNDPASTPTRPPSTAAGPQRSVTETNSRSTIEAARVHGAAPKPPPVAQTAQAAVDAAALLPKPDLVITGVTGTHVKGAGNPGSLTWKFLVEIKNNGLTEAGGSVLCAHENPALAQQASKNPVPKLGSQATAKVEYWYGKPSWAFMDGGERTKRPLSFVADCQNSVAEGSETNNRYQVWLYWDPTEAKTWEPAQ